MRTAKDILLNYWIGKSYPIDSYLIAYYKNLGGKLYIENKKQVVEVNAFLSEYRKKFIVARLLGYFFNDIFEVSLSEEDLKKPTYHIGKETSRFAIDLLIPPTFLNHLIFDKKISNIDALAELLAVSKSSLTYKLKRLNII